MSECINTNIAELGLFQRDLDAFERALPESAVSTAFFRQSSVYLETLMARIASAPPGDGYQMLRLFALRYLDTSRPTFSAYNVLMAITASNDGRFKRLAMPVLYEMAPLLLGQHYLTDDSWFDSVQRLDCVKLFFDTCDQAGLSFFQNPPLSVVTQTTTEDDLVTTLQPTHTLELGIGNQRVVLSAAVRPYISVRRDKRLAVESPTILIGKAIITPNTGSFVIESTVWLTDAAVGLLQYAHALRSGYTPGRATEITLGGPLHRCELTCMSHDSGTSWRVVNIRFLPPE